MLDQSKNTRRQGIQALYTFTPFKLLRSSGDAYSLILTPVAYLKEEPCIEWRSRKCKDRFQISKPTFSKTIVQPYEIYNQKFSLESKNRFIYKPKENRVPSYPPAYMEFSYQSLRSGYYCTLGYVLISSSLRCPISKVCPYLRGSPCKHYRGPIAYTSLYNVYPRIQKRFDDPISPNLFKPLIAVRYESNPLILLRFTENGSFLAFIDGVNFIPKSPWINRQITVFLQEGLGFKIPNVHAIEFEFNYETLKELLQKLLESDIDLARWIAIKYELFHDNGVFREKRGFRAFEKLNKIVEQNLKGEGDREIKTVVNKICHPTISLSLIDFHVCSVK